MKKIFAALGATVAGFALAAGIAFVSNAVGQNVAYASSTIPCIKVTDGINVNNANSNATVKLTGGCGTHKLEMKSYYAPSSTGAPHDQQVLAFTGDSKYLNPGSDPYKFFVETPNHDASCFYQVDLVDMDLNGNNNVVVASKTGGNHDCTPSQVHSYVCSAFGLTAGDNRTATISTFATQVVNATFTGATINWGDGTTQNVSTAKDQSHQYTADNTYNVSVVAHFTYTGRFGDVHNVDAAACGGPVTFTPPQTPNQIPVCEIATRTVIMIDEDLLGTPQYPADQYTTDLSKCVVNYVPVCQIATNTVITIDESLLGSAQYPADQYTTDLSKCVVTPPVTPPTTPRVTPPATLVNTGAGSVVALAGTAGIVAAATHAIWRRRSN